MKKKMYHTWVVVLAIIGACITMIINCISLGGAMKNSMGSVFKENSAIHNWKNYGDSGEESPQEPSPQKPSDESSKEDTTGVDPATEDLAGIASYEAEGTTITHKIEIYSLYKQIDDNGGQVYLNVQYPVLSGTDGALTETINKILKDQAMVSADNYYLNLEGRSKVQAGSTGMYIVSEVTYNVVYLSNDFISVVFEDRYCAGDYYAQCLDMRSCNIDLKTGKAYDLKQVVNADQKMAEDFAKRLDDKYQSEDVISNTSSSDYLNMMRGNTTESGSFMGFYRTEKGIEIYMTFHYKDTTNSAVGWLTAPYDAEAIKTIQNQSEYWNIAQ